MITVDELIRNARAAQQVLEGYSQKQVDALVKAMGRVIYDNAELLAREAVEETGYGLVESKTLKQKKTAMATWYYLSDKKSVGIIEEDVINCTATFAKPMGVVACVTPSTNPTSTVCGNGMNIIKSRNAMIVAPHPRARKCTVHGVALINKALAALGAPTGLVQIFEEPTMETTQELMKKADAIVATGGFGMIKAAYSSGKPSYGVGQGNVQCLVAPDYKDYGEVAQKLVSGRSYDNGMPCVCEQAAFFPRAGSAAIVEQMRKAGALLITEEQADKLRTLLFKEDGAINPMYVGMTAKTLAAKIDANAEENTKILLVEGKGLGRENRLCKEKLCPVLQYFIYDDFEQALDGAKINLLMEGAGHTATVFTNSRETAELVGASLPVGRVCVNQSGANASGGSLMNGFAPTMSLGCGSWGNNSISENLTYKHLMNKTVVAYLKPGFTPPTADEIWAL